MQGLFFNRKSPVFNIDLKKRRFDTDGGIPMKKLEEYVLSIPDFPEPGIIFRDVTSVLIGASKPSQILNNIKAAENTSFTQEELAEIDKLSL